MSGEKLPAVSVIVLNFNGREHLEACFSSLAELDYPAERLELMLCDNGSTDDSRSFMARRFPSIRVLALDRNYGFAEGNDRAAAQARFEWVAFLNNDMRVEPSWLREMVAPLREQPALACISSKILSWDGARIDFIGAGASFQGFGFQFDFGKESSPMDEARRIFAPCGGAMLIRKDLFLDLGGFDPDYFAFYEDLDLGWRLNLAGHDIWYTPAARTYHRHHGYHRRTPEHTLRSLYERNALFTMYKNLDDDNLKAALPAALLLLNEKALEMGQVDRTPFRPLAIRQTSAVSSMPAAEPGLGLKFRRVLREQGLSAVPGRGLRFARTRARRGVDRFRRQLARGFALVPYVTMSHYVGLSEFAHSLEALQRKRRLVQQRRVRSDAELLPLFYFALEPSYHQGRYIEFHRWLCRVLDLEDRFGPGHLNRG